MNPRVTAILKDLAGYRAEVGEALDKIQAGIWEISQMVPAQEEEPETIPAQPEQPATVHNAVLTGAMGIEMVASKISAAERGTVFQCLGTLPTIRIGGLAGVKPGKHNQVAHHADGSPIEDITFKGDTGSLMPGEPGDYAATLTGLLFHNSLGGFNNVFFELLRMRPRMDGDRAVVLCEENFHEDKHQGGLFGIDDCYLYAPEDYNSFDGYGMKQLIVPRSCRFDISGITATPPREHGLIYGHNIRGDSFLSNSRVLTRVINGIEVGPGRSLVQFQERRKDGLPSFGTISVDTISGELCGSEGVLAGNTATGAAALTVGGHNGIVKFSNIDLRDQLTAVISNWVETEKDGSNKGYRDPSITRVEYRNITWNEHNHPKQSPRVKVKISGAESVYARNVGPYGSPIVNPWDSPHVKMNDDPSTDPLTPARVDWR